MSYTVLNKLQSYFKIENLDKQKESYISDLFDNVGGQIKEMDMKAGKIIFLDYDNEITYSFEEHFIRELNDFKNTKEQIDSIFIELEGKIEKKGFIEYLKRTISLILNNKKLFLNYPFLKDLIFEFTDYLNKKYELRISIPFIIKSSNTEFIKPFFIKPKYNKTEKISLFYNLLSNQEIIDKSTITKEEFKDVITGEETSSKIYFTCYTYKAVYVLSSISHIYIKFTGTIVEKSNRFYTKQNKNITRRIYDTENSRISMEKKKELKKYKQEINKIFN